MRERWIDHGNGILTIETNTIHVRLRSQARKNYRNTQSNWRLFFPVRDNMAMLVCLVMILEVRSTKH